MKSPAAYYLLLLYTMVILQPLLPAVSDWWSHEFNATAHIAAVHARFGANHLQKELASAGSESKKENTQKAEDTASPHVSPLPSALDFAVTMPVVAHLGLPRTNLPFVFCSIQIPPPKFS